jgi:hypothetical protein
MFDTGANHTSVGPSLLAALGLVSIGSVQTHTASGVATVQYYRVSLTLFDPTTAGAPTMFRPTWTVTNLPHDLPDTDVIIGMDLIDEIILNINGPGKQFTLTF